MWLKRMIKDRQDILVLGELLLFLSAWALCIASALDEHRIRTNGNADNNVAANLDPTMPGPSDQRGDYE